MRITKVSAYPVRVPLLGVEKGGIAPYLTSHGEINAACSTIVKVETDEGITGWGEVDMIFSPKTMKSLIENDLGPRVKGRHPSQIINSANRLCFHFIYSDIFTASLEMACWDIIGKMAGMPIYMLIGGRLRKKVAISYCLGILDLETTAARVEKILEQGYRTLKTKAGRDLPSDVKRLRKIRQVAGIGLNLRVDLNQALSPSEALRFLKQLEEIDLQYIEQPIRVDSFSDLLALRRRTRIPIAVNEDCYIPRNLFNLIKLGAIDAAVVDLEPLGGLSGLIKIASLAEEANLPLAHHCQFDLGVKTAAILQTTSSIPSFSYAMDSTYYAQKDDILDAPLEIEQGHFRMPEGPGLGIEINEEKLKQYKA